ncbi:MAG TPA: serine hydrolase domain-containing protein [Steroidobacteraceae bacterium]|nr:serine hydrolase domain-containing protein [Steroidobacteraceae bacterium]
MPAGNNKKPLAELHREGISATCSLRSLLLLLALLVLVSACGGGGGSTSTGPQPDTSAPPTTLSRGELAAAELLEAGATPAGPIENRFFMPIGASRPALHRLRGQLSAPEAPMQATTPDSNFGQTGLAWFPGFVADFLVVGDYLVPAQRGILERRGARSHWRIILSPGRVWSETGDEGWSRASFPFVLVSDDTNEVHNGLATFVFDDARTSQLQFQVVQETASWNRSDFWGQVPLAYAPGPVADEAAHEVAFAAELTALTPIRDWSELGTGRDAALWGTFTRGLDSDDISASGIVRDGIIYMRPCATRLGDYPYCEFMRQGAFSVTKSMGAALTLLRLAQKYGDEILEYPIRDYVAVTALHPGWDAVRFIDVIDMATGVGGANPDRDALDPFADENAVTLGAWSSVTSEGSKLNAVFEQPDYGWGPGEVFRYNTTHTFVLAVAMQELVARREGRDVRLWDLMMREVFEPIGIRHLPMMHTIEAETTAGIPLMGIGLYPTVDDVAKIATLLQNGGRQAGVQLLSARGLDTALFRSGHGLPTGEVTDAGVQLYSMSFWSLPYRLARCTQQLPYMDGYGGNFVLLLPNGLTAFRFADAGNYDVDALGDAAALIRPWCQ